MKRHLAALVAACLIAVLSGATLAGAQDGDGGGVPDYLAIQAVDATTPGTVEMVVGYGGSASQLEQATIVANDEEHSPSQVELLEGGDTLVVLVVDTSEAMRQGDALTQLKRVLADFVEDRPEGQRVGIVALGDGGRVVQTPTADTSRLLSAIDGLALSGSAASTTGIDIGARMIADSTARQSHLVAVVGGPNTGSVSGARARGSLSNTGAAAWIIALEDRGARENEGFFRSVVDASGGSYTGTVNLDTVPGHLADVGEQIASHYAVSFDSDLSGPVDLTLTAGGESTSVSFVTGSSASGATALRPFEPIQPGGLAFFRDNGWVIGMAAAILAAVLAAYAVGSLVFPDRSELDSALEYYEAPSGSTGIDIDGDDDGSGLARTALIQKAVGYTEQFAESQGYLAKVEGTLERADLPLRAAEAIFFYAAGVVIGLGLAFALTGGNLMGTLVATGLVALIPPGIITFLANRRQKKFEGLLPDTLNLLAGTLRAGYSLMQGVEAVSREVSEPMGKELRRVVTEARLGRPLEESMEASADRMDSPDFAWAVMAIRIQREVGGNLAELLVTVADTMTQRERLRRDVNALTAEGKVSAMVLGALPVGLGLFMYMSNPDYIGVLFEERVGNFLIGGAVVLALVGFVWMKKVIEVDV